MVAGALSSFELIGHVTMETDGEGNYTGRIFIERKSGTWALTIEPHDLRDRATGARSRDTRASDRSQP